MKNRRPGWKTVPMPERIAALPRSAGGLPVPYVAQWEGEDEMLVAPCQWADGKPAIFPVRSGLGITRPVFGVMDPSRQREAVRAVLCQVCHVQLGPMSDVLEPGREPLWLIDMLHEPDTLRGHKVALEPWVCDDCLVYALQVCPGMLARSSKVERETIVDPTLLLKNVLAVWTANVFGTSVIPGGNLKGRPPCIGYLKIEPLVFTRTRATYLLEYGPAAIRQMLLEDPDVPGGNRP